MHCGVPGVHARRVRREFGSRALVALEDARFVEELRDFVQEAVQLRCEPGLELRHEDFGLVRPDDPPRAVDTDLSLQPAGDGCVEAGEVSVPFVHRDSMAAPGMFRRARA